MAAASRDRNTTGLVPEGNGISNSMMGKFKSAGAGERTLARIAGGHIQLCATALRKYWVLSIQVQVVDGLVHLHTSTAHPSGAGNFCWQTGGL